MTAEGTSAEKRPDFSTPSSSCSTPAIITAVRNGPIPPRCWTSTSTMDVRPAAGPVTESGDREMNGTTMPPTMPAIRPDTGGTPQAMAMPRQSGRATRNTTTPATASSLAWPNIDGWWCISLVHRTFTQNEPHPSVERGRSDTDTERLFGMRGRLSERPKSGAAPGRARAGGGPTSAVWSAGGEQWKGRRPGSEHRAGAPTLRLGSRNPSLAARKPPMSAPPRGRRAVMRLHGYGGRLLRSRAAAHCLALFERPVPVRAARPHERPTSRTP